MKLTTIDLLSDSNVAQDSEKIGSTLECKFVLITNISEHILIFGPLEIYNYHAQLIDKFCTDRKIDSIWRKKPDLFEILDNSLKINGGGWFQIDFLKKTLSAMHLSTAYGRFDEDIFNLFKNEKQIFKDFNISVRK